MTALQLVLVVAAYLVGAIPFGLVLTRAFTGRDVRTVGSGNIGASNAARAAGKAVGALTLVLDAAKAAVPMLVARGLGAGEGTVVAVGLAAFVGHLYPVWLRFRGGKGVATGLGVFAVLAPVPALVALAGFAVAYGATRIPAIGSLTGTALCCGGAFVQELLVRGRGALQTPVPWAGLAVALAILWRHRENLQRLARGAEHKV